jgi:hypothetical protein
MKKVEWTSRPVAKTSRNVAFGSLVLLGSILKVAQQSSITAQRHAFVPLLVVAWWRFGHQLTSVVRENHESLRAFAFLVDM